jgi:hypothetical protein
MGSAIHRRLPGGTISTVLMLRMFLLAREKKGSEAGADGEKRLSNSGKQPVSRTTRSLLELIVCHGSAGQMDGDVGGNQVKPDASLRSCSVVL